MAKITEAEAQFEQLQKDMRNEALEWIANIFYNVCLNSVDRANSDMEVAESTGNWVSKWQRLKYTEEQREFIRAEYKKSAIDKLTLALLKESAPDIQLAAVKTMPVKETA